MLARHTARFDGTAEPRLTGAEPARYVIRAQGTVDARWSDRLGGMRLTPATDGPAAATVLTGELADQAALLGVLNCLYNLGLPLVSVQCLGPSRPHAIGSATGPSAGASRGLGGGELAGASLAAGKPEGSGTRVATVAYPKRHLIFKPGEGANRLYLVRSGCVRLFKCLPDGREVNVGLLGPRSAFAQETEVRGLPTGVAAQALIESQITVIPEEVLEATIAASPELAVAVVDAMARRLTAAQVFIEQLLIRDTAVRLAGVLADLADALGQPRTDGLVEIPLTLSHQTLANMVGANRVTVTRKLAALEAAGMIRFRGPRGAVADPPRLRAYARAGMTTA
jgi:CRP/FNR family transcriptional regulator